MAEWLRIERARWEELDETARRLARISGDMKAQLDALRAERDDLRAENELLQEQVMATQRDDDGIDALRARIAELEAAGRAVIGCTDQVCAFAPNRCEAQCRADEMLRAALRASASAGGGQ